MIRVYVGAPLLTLLIVGVDPNLRYACVATAINLAARKGELEIVKLLVAAGAEVAGHNARWVYGSSDG